MKVNLVLLFCILGPLVTGAQADYAISKIPDSLLKNANVVKRMEDVRFEIINTGEAVLKQKYALTILNENGSQMASFMESYDKFTDIRSVEASLYDATGKLIRKAKGKDIMDISGTDDNNLFDDSRRKLFNFFYKLYPFTVEYEFEMKIKGTLYFPSWLPQEDEFFSVQQSSISVIFPTFYTVRYKSYNYKSEPVVSTEKDKKMLKWEVRELPAIKYEFASPGWYELNPVVFFGPTEFELQGYKGNMNSWQDFGKFVYSLKQGRDQLPDNVKQTVHQIADRTTDVKEKIGNLYRYLQKNTRYISIQLGIGGWQPFDARYVAAKAYGDCKALTNYMYSLLKEAGINSFYTLVKAGQNANRIIDDFPSQQFNHVILCVPTGKDTTWLECTSQTLPAGYLSDFTNDRYALLVDGDGGKLIRTPKYGLKENLQLRDIKAKLDEDGTLNLNVATNYGGMQQDLLHQLVNNLSRDKVKEYLHEELDFATYDVKNFEYKENKSVLPSIDESLELEVKNYANITGKRLFIVPNVMTRSHRKLNAGEERKFDLDIKYEYRDIDSVEIELPKGYQPEAMPQNIALTGKFGIYLSTVRLSENKIIYSRSIEIFSGRFPAKDYDELAKFYDAIYKADRNKVVLVKNEPAQKGF